MTDMQIMVCGSIGYGGINEIRQLCLFLRREGFGIADHLLDENMDYSGIKDFRDKKDLSSKIVNHDFEYIKKADVLIVLSSKPSYGAAIEMFVAKNSGKPVILFAKESVPTPWPINFSDYIVTAEEELITLLRQLETY
jgi:nucleoside 2-deoxyribosyltransferase